MLDADGSCPNRLCTDPGRRISRIHAIAYQSGPLRRVISNYKYDGAHAWALVFGRLVLGWLEQHARGDPPDLIVVNPTYTGPRTAQKRILVYDDICTTASQLDAVAECLLDDGRASRVEGLVLARAPWRRRT